jgi:hypothetical protein
MRTALIVSESERTRRVLLERLIAAGFYVEWAISPLDARLRMAQINPDLAIIDHTSKGSLSDEAAAGFGARDAMRRTLYVQVGRFPGSDSEERRVTIVQLRDSGRAAADAVDRVAQAISVWR